jgi:outer membrane protein TolC
MARQGKLPRAIALGIWGTLLPLLPILGEEPAFSPLPMPEQGIGSPSPSHSESEASVEPSVPLSPSTPFPSTSLQDDRTQVLLTLPELLNLVVTGNRDLRDRQLQRLIDQQKLIEAEARFDPRFTPAVGVGLRQNFYEDGGSSISLPGIIGGTDTTELSDTTSVNQSAGFLGRVQTRQGTRLEVTLDALSDTPIGIFFTQPLLRGAGTTINEAPVEIARLQEARNFYNLQQTLIDTVSTTITQYTTLIQAQEAVRIQVQALERRRRQLEILTALVAAGRRAEVNLVDSRRSVADAERDLLVAQTQLEAANSDLLNQIGSDRSILFVASTETVAQLFAAAAAQVEEFDVEALIAIAYRTRPDYLQTELDQNIADLNLRLAADDLRWQLDIVGGINLGNLSDTSLGAVARRTFEDPALETAQVRREVEIQQRANQLAKQQTAIRNQITTQINTVTANLARVEAARRSTENAQLQLQVTQELFRRGREGGTLSEIIKQEENLVKAQNSQLQAEIAFLNSVVSLDKAVGLTLEAWSGAVDFLPLLVTPATF